VKVYYDTGILLKLYVEEPQSARVRKFVSRGKKAIRLHDLHRAEMVSALRLKQFRGEGKAEQVAQTLLHLTEDERCGVLRHVEMDWPAVWRQCFELSTAHTGSTGCRTLDTLHVSCALYLRAPEFVTSDGRQAEMARLAGLRVVNPCSAE
jgi:predicted nucleic acid-binding protein